MRLTSEHEPVAPTLAAPCAGAEAQLRLDSAPAPLRRDNADAVPAYLADTYSWAYLWPGSIRLLDRPLVVSTILWGNDRRLLRAALEEMRPGQRVLQPACVYGDLSPRLAAFLGPKGRLDVHDVAPQQIENCQRKLRSYANVTMQVRDAAEPAGALYDVACCFFLLHEVPDDYKARVVDAMLAAVRPGGKAVFIDYARPHWAHPLKPITAIVFRWLEPFARALWDTAIRDYSGPGGDQFTWTTRTYFGGLYQKTVATRVA